MKHCIYNSTRCVICRRPLPPEGRGHKRQCNAGLGDIVAAGLEAVGVTKERVSAVLGRPCACPQRQEALNQLGAKYLGIGVDNE
jgi:hypothetical protein